MSGHKKLRVAVLLGGPSAEREVSLKSGAAVARALRSLGHTVAEVDPADPDWALPPGAQVVFLALHGTYGEDGQVQQRLEELRVPYTGCGPESSRIAFNKILTKKRCLAAGVATPRYAALTASTTDWPAGWEPPVVLKPVRQGSSVGLHIVSRREEFLPALAEALRHDTEVLMEEQIFGRETTVGILGDAALPVVEIRVKSNGPFDYRSKYTAGAAEHLCPAPLDEATTARAQRAALDAFRAVGGRDYARVDVMVKPDGEPVVLEINTLPGMTELSLLPEAAKAAGLDYPQLCQRMIDLALRRRET